MNNNNKSKLFFKGSSETIIDKFMNKYIVYISYDERK